MTEAASLKTPWELGKFGVWGPRGEPSCPQLKSLGVLMRSEKQGWWVMQSVEDVGPQNMCFFPLQN